MSIARVFPRRTSCTPNDEYAFVGDIPLFFPEDITEVHVSVTFSWDLPEAERLAKAWGRVAPVKIGGPATGERGEAFVPGLYLKNGCVITSRGCPNRCWFCSVPKREGPLRELPITSGNNVLDDNLLACSDEHINAVFTMLEKQPKVMFTGGLEAKRLKKWHVEAFKRVKAQEVFFAYDTPDDWEPLMHALDLCLNSSWYAYRKVRCYVLCGYPGDTLAAAEQRCEEVLMQGAFPFAMFYRDADGKNQKDADWRKFQHKWSRPAVIYTTAGKIGLLEDGEFIGRVEKRREVRYRKEVA